MVATTKLGKLNLINRQTETDTGARRGTRRAKVLSPLSINTYDLIPKGSCAYNTQNQDKIETLL